MGRASSVTGASLILAVALTACGASNAADGPPSRKTLTVAAVERYLGEVPLPSGARPADVSDLQGAHAVAVEHVDTPQAIDRKAAYVVPMSGSDTVRFYETHRPPGTVVDSPGMSNVSSGTDMIYEHDQHGPDPAYDNLMIQVDVTDHGPHQALVRVYVEAVYLVGNVASTHVPASATSVDVVRVDSSGPTTRATLTGGPMHKLIARIATLTAVQPGTYNCPLGRRGHDTLTFHGPWPDRQYDVATSGCAWITVSVGGTRLTTSLDGGGPLDLLVDKLLSATGH